MVDSLAAEVSDSSLDLLDLAIMENVQLLVIDRCLYFHQAKHGMKEIGVRKGLVCLLLECFFIDFKTVLIYFVWSKNF